MEAQLPDKPHEVETHKNRKMMQDSNSLCTTPTKFLDQKFARNCELYIEILHVIPFQLRNTATYTNHQKYWSAVTTVHPTAHGMSNYFIGRLKMMISLSI
jgi:hypothetical protein